MRNSARPPRIAVVCDLREENWPSMNLVADMLLENTGARHGHVIETIRLCPPMRRRFSHAGQNGSRFNADRLLNRFWDYPRHLRSRRKEFDLFHVVDHSYAQLIHHLPAERTVVTCHDLDAFRCLVDPAEEPRTPLFRTMMRRVLAGLQKAARVVCVSEATRIELLAHGLLPSERLAVVPNGVHPAFRPDPDAPADEEAARLLGPADKAAPELLHVGSTIARKRIDVLLEVFAGVRLRFPRARLLRVGGSLTTAQQALAASLGVGEFIVELPNLKTEILAAIYRRASVLLQPSEREGFGLPVIEALACGTRVLASDLPVLREVGDSAVSYCAVGDSAAWTENVTGLLNESDGHSEKLDARRAAGYAQAARFSWAEHANKMVEVYRQLL